MAEQARAIRTRQTILSAAAKIFEEHGYQAATISQILSQAGVTKGALYFHFQSKEDLAQGVLAEQDQQFDVPSRASKVQEIVDAVMLHAHRLQTDPMVRAGVRLSMDQLAQGLDRSGPFIRWSEVGLELLRKAKAQGELLPHVVPSETADVIVGSFAGIQSMSQAICDYRDLVGRVSALMRHLLPSVVVPSVLASLDLSEIRGASVYAEATAAAQVREVAGALS
ncbi:ScbR family autoregulator-binding transcription factor [Streptomyces sp. H34-S4]|uniref:ScbR family autoregulator-binding transcription factor n=1 Tax=Streptomyces sp. H34-S4 TaxID=2996463 RepID=UPI00226E1E18|nr:ScbR family autoregulator-binding transcription factor [Streptomyces sp. H34-S4]MCY0935086.1 ScbR family autoregulator-binding transcription factor [Streptomyces sp. H34-S4]